ncbi:hypothetical protein CRG98_023008 [Punica granatum]|uniref:Uncharacterized protein n=1 Tax=Punica granatum TaxID=22663 RepID=A0A2I0JK12_PUNGR|nr:hypothetical protein CRG98_023008 [Punica granatum]
MDSLSSAPKQSQQYQHALVMRHGDRIDELVDFWLSNATRPWDPPLVNAGCVRAFHTGAKLRTQLGFPIHRVSIEYGISEIFNGMSIKTPPKDGEWGFNLPELELKFPAGTLDPEFEPVVKEVENGTFVAYFPTFTS